MPIPAGILALIQAGRIAAPLAARTLAGTTAAGLQKVQRGGKTFWRKMGSDEPWITNPKPPGKIKQAINKARNLPDNISMPISGGVTIPMIGLMQEDKKRMKELEEAEIYKHGIWGLHDPERKYYPPRTTRGLKRGFHQ
jgi:hypothetical protein